MRPRLLTAMIKDPHYIQSTDFEDVMDLMGNLHDHLYKDGKTDTENNPEGVAYAHTDLAEVEQQFRRIESYIIGVDRSKTFTVLQEIGLQKVSMLHGIREIITNYLSDLIEIQSEVKRYEERCVRIENYRQNDSTQNETNEQGETNSEFNYPGAERGNNANAHDENAIEEFREGPNPPPNLHNDQTPTRNERKAKKVRKRWSTERKREKKRKQKARRKLRFDNESTDEEEEERQSKSPSSPSSSSSSSSSASSSESSSDNTRRKRKKKKKQSKKKGIYAKKTKSKKSLAIMPSYRLKMPEINTYSKTEDPDGSAGINFLIQLESHATGCTETDKWLILCRCLTGNAQTWLNENKKGLERKNWAGICGKFLQFVTGKNVEEHYSDFADVNNYTSNGETWEDVYFSMQRSINCMDIVNNADPKGEQQHISSKRFIAVFIAALRLTKSYMLARHLYNMRKAFRTPAEMYEECQSYTHDHRKHANNRNKTQKGNEKRNWRNGNINEVQQQQTPSNEQLTVLLAQLSEKVDALQIGEKGKVNNVNVNKSDNANKPSSTATKKECRNCQKIVEHQHWQCPERVCTRCGNKGHYRHQCKTGKEKVAEYQNSKKVNTVANESGKQATVENNTDSSENEEEYEQDFQ